MIERSLRRGAPFALALLACGCAWTNRANRPVWNSFEEHVVPEGDAAFYATLPLTIPTGFAAIATDTFVVHPVQVMDDAWGDAADLWDDLDWATEYYTELAILPFRAGATPVVLVGSFLGRSAFDIPPHDSTRAARATQEPPILPREPAPELVIEPRVTEAPQEQALALLERVAARDPDPGLPGAV
ncbi:MAG: hypothetical protein ACREI7_04920, partial [Myxococcota bacterium]